MLMRGKNTLCDKSCHFFFAVLRVVAIHFEKSVKAVVLTFSRCMRGSDNTPSTFMREPKPKLGGILSASGVTVSLPWAGKPVPRTYL